jgi:EPS-associated MarR family transcriptional regulator
MNAIPPTSTPSSAPPHGVPGRAMHLPPAADPDATPLAVLRLLTERPEISQRELSIALGLSLGKTHYTLRALLDRGLVKAGNFRRSDRKLAYAYLLTPAGMTEKLRLTRGFLRRKEAEFEHLQTTIAALRAEVERDPIADDA